MITKNLSVLKLFKNLKILRLSQTTVHSGFSSIIKSQALEVFEIPHLVCDASEYFCLCENVKHATCLRTLDLSYIHFSEHSNISKYDLESSSYNEAAIALSNAISFCSNLQELKLTDCGIKQTGAKALALLIQNCASLISIDLSLNCFSAVLKEEELTNYRKPEELLEFEI